MYSLVQFIEDDVYHICKSKAIKTSKGKDVLARWIDSRCYPAKIITKHDDYHSLNNLKSSLISSTPVVLCANLSLVSKMAVCTKTVPLSSNVKSSTSGRRSYITRRRLKFNDIDRSVVSHNASKEVMELDPVPVAEIINTLTPTVDMLVSTDDVSKKVMVPDIITDQVPVAEIITTPTPTVDMEMSIDDCEETVELNNTTQAITELDNINASIAIVDDHNVNLINLQDTLMSEDYCNSNFQTSTSFVQVPSTSVSTRRKKYVKNASAYYDRNEVVTPSISWNAIVPENLQVNAAKSNKRQYFCIYCKKLYSKFPQHLQISHKNEPAVKTFMMLPSKCLERRKIIETIRRRGDFEHNTNVEYNSGQLFVARRSTIDFPHVTKDYLPCPNCNSFFNRTTIRFHTKHCIPAKDRIKNSTVLFGRRLMRVLHPRANAILKDKIFPVLRDDNCVTIVRCDLLVILLGNLLSGKYSSQHHHDMIRNKLRLIGRLILTAKSLDNNITDFASLLTPAKFDIVVEAIKRVGGLNSACTTYKSPSTVLALSTLCKQAVPVWITECIKSSNSIAKQQAEDFLVLFNTTFPSELGRTALDTRLQHQRHKDIQLPLKSDIEKLVSYLREGRRKWFYIVNKNECPNIRHAWKELASYTLVSTMVFNRRRPGELERITITDFSKLRSADSISSLAGNLRSKEDTQLARRYKRFEIRGKLNRTVPVLINFEIEKCLNLVIKKRAEVGVPSDNPYVFGLPETDHRHRYLRAYVLLREYSVCCGASRPLLLRGTQLRKQIATECAVRDLSDNVIKDVANFMGHAKDIHDNIYRMPVDNRDIIQMSRILETIQGNCDSDSDSDYENDPQIQPNTSTVEAVSEISLENLEDENNTFSSDVNKEEIEASTSYEIISSTKPSSSENYVNKNIKTHSRGLKRICGSKSPWGSEEKRAVLIHFGKYLKKNKLPSMKFLIEKLPCISSLQSRSPTSVRLWMQNELVRRKKQSEGATSDSYENITTLFTRKKWSSPMKRALKDIFMEHLDNDTLPSNSECLIAMERYPEFQNLTVAAIKTAVANEQKRIHKISHLNKMTAL